MILTPALLGKEILKEKWEIPKHIRLLDVLLLNLANRSLHRLIVNIPPRHGKSDLIAKFFLFWYIENFPTHRIILVTYQNRFAEVWGRRLRDLIALYGKEFFKIELDPKESSARQIRINKFGGMVYCVGSFGPLTGRGAEVIVIDDPIKNDCEAMSPRLRENLWDWFKATLYTRLEPNGVLLLVMTRWHNDDIVARLEKSFKVVEYTKEVQEESKLELPSDKWLLVRLPAIAEPNDPLCRQTGEALWSSRFPIHLLLERKKVLGDYWFSALYQQNPKPLTGKIFHREKFNYFISKGENLELFTK